MSNLNSLMDKILKILNLNDEAKKAFMEEYNILVTKRLSAVLLERLSGEDDFKKVVTGQSLNPANFYDYLDKKLTPEEKQDLFNFCKFTMFLELIEPILEGASPEEKAKIETILKADEGFVGMYDSLKQIAPN